jgi:hypothetical protein
LNKEFVAVASQLQRLKSIGTFHHGMLPPGTSGIPDHAAVWPESSVSGAHFASGHPVNGFVLGYFGRNGSVGVAEASHILVVNLDYRQPRSIKLAAHAPLSQFDAQAGSWRAAGSDHVELRLAPGEGRLLRIDP